MSSAPQATTLTSAQCLSDGRSRPVTLPEVEILPSMSPKRESCDISNSSTSTSTPSTQAHYDSEANVANDAVVQKGDLSDNERAKASMPPVGREVDMDPRLTELQPCVNCEALGHKCDGVPCMECESREVKCTPTREALERALRGVAVHFETKIEELQSLRGTINPESVLKMLSEEIFSKDGLRFNFRVHKGKTQLVSFVRRCYSCHPDKLECVRNQDDKRCATCIKANRSCKRSALTFTYSDTRYNHLGDRFCNNYEKLTRLGADARHSIRATDRQRAVTIKHNLSPQRSGMYGAPVDAVISALDELESSSAVGDGKLGPGGPNRPMGATNARDATGNQEERRTVSTLDLSLLVDKASGVARNEKGGFSDVYEGTLRLPQMDMVKVALKQLRTNVERLDGEEGQKLLRETLVWSRLRHPNILPFLGTAYPDKHTICFVSPWMAHGDIMTYLEKRDVVNRIALLCGIAEGVQYLHTLTPPVFHGDIKGANILISDEGKPMLCDFGLAIFTNNIGATTTSAGNGSRRWMAPERLEPEKFGFTLSTSRTPSADIFSLGMTCYEIISGKVPYHGARDIQAAFAIVAGRRPSFGVLLHGHPNRTALLSLLDDCWAEDWRKRPTAAEISQFLSSLSQDSLWLLMRDRQKEDSKKRLEGDLPARLSEAPNPEIGNFEMDIQQVVSILDISEVFPWIHVFNLMTEEAPEVDGIKDLTSSISLSANRWSITSGAFADVFCEDMQISGERQSLRLKVSLKQPRGKARTEVAMRRHKRDMRIWSKLRHPNVLPLLGIASVPEGVPCSISPWMPEGNLRDYVRAHEFVDRLEIVHGILQGLIYLHEQKPAIAHGDIQGSNILVASNGSPLIAGFGLAVLLDSDTYGRTTTSAQSSSTRWLAPERLFPEKFGLRTAQSISTAADMFSFAMTTIEGLSGDLPFSGKSSVSVAASIMHGQRPDIPYPYVFDPEFEGLRAAIRGCWEQDREKRWTAVEVLTLLR